MPAYSNSNPLLKPDLPQCGDHAHYVAFAKSSGVGHTRCLASDSPSIVTLTDSHCAHSRQSVVLLVGWLLIVVMGSAALLHLLERAAPVEARVQAPKLRGTGDAIIDVERARKDLLAASPQYIGIGNSMMFTRLGKSPAALSALSGQEFFFFYKNGSDAPIWYLVIKNIIGQSRVRPKAVLLFVRDNELTAEFSGENEGAAPYLKSLQGTAEPELDSYMQKSDAIATSVLDSWFTFPALQDKASNRLTDLALDLGGAGMPKKALRFMLTERFGLNHLRKDIGSEFQEKNASLPDVAGVERSLLPLILEETDKLGAKLIVFRVKRRPDALTQLPPEPAAMRAYSEAMRDWLQTRGAIWFDETYDDQIKLSDYLDGDHISPERLEWYRAYFWQRMKGLFP